MAYTLASIRTSVQARVKDTGFSSTLIDEFINDVQADVFNEYRLNFMEAYTTYTTVSNVADITNGVGLPSNYMVAIDLSNTTSGSLLIPYKDVSYLDSVTNTSTTSTSSPAFWYMFGQTPMLYPVPSASLTLRLRYYKTPTLLVADADVPSLPSSFRELFVVGAASRVMQVKDNYDQAAILQNKYDEILAKLVNQTAVRQVGTSPQQRTNRTVVLKRHF